MAGGRLTGGQSYLKRCSLKDKEVAELSAHHLVIIIAAARDDQPNLVEFCPLSVDRHVK